MEKIVNRINTKKYFIITLCLLTISIFIMNFLTIWAADDYANYVSIWIKNSQFNIMEIIRNTNRLYLSWTGRYLSTFLLDVFLYFNKNIFNIVNTVIYMINIIIIYKIVNINQTAESPKKYNTISLILIQLFLWIFIPAMGQVCFWEIGSIIYLWMMVLVNAVLLLFIKLFKNQDSIKSSIKNCILISLLSLLAGNGLETNSLMLAVFLTIIIFIMFIQKKKIPLWSILSYSFFIIGMLSNVLSPGNGARMAEMTGTTSLISKIYYGVGPWYYNGIVLSKIFILLPVSLIIYSIYLLSKTKTGERKNLVIPIGGITIFITSVIFVSLFVFSDSIQTFLNWYYPNAKKFAIIVLTMLGILAATVITVFFKRKKTFPKSISFQNTLYLTLVVSACAGIASYILVPTSWPRSYMGMNIFIAIGTVYLINQIDFAHISKTFKVMYRICFILVSIFFIATYLITVKDMYHSKKWEMDTNNTIKQQIEEKNDIIYVKTFMSTNDHNPASVEKWVIPAKINDPEMMTEDGIHKYYEWINIAVTNYHFNDVNAWNNGKRIIGYE